MSVASSANIFSHSVGCLFIFFMVSFALQKLLSLIRSHLFIFTFIAFASGNRSKKNIAIIYVKECSMFSSRSFMVSGLTFRSLIYFQFIFVYGVRKCSNLIVYVNKTTKQLTEWEIISLNDITDKGLISKIYKQLIQLNIKKIKQLSQKIGRRPEQTFFQRVYIDD